MTGGVSYMPYNTNRAAVRPNLFMKLDNVIFSRDAINSDGRIVANWQGDTVEFFTDQINV